MKYLLLRFLCYIPFAVAIILTRDIPLVFGFVVGVCLVLYAIIWHALTQKQAVVNAQKAHDKWVAEMNDSINYPTWP